MKYNPLEARMLFIDGPVAIYISTASREDIVAAIERLTSYVYLAADHLHEEHAKQVLEVGNATARPLG